MLISNGQLDDVTNGLTFNIVDERFRDFVTNTDDVSLRNWRIAYLSGPDKANPWDEGYIKPTFNHEPRQVYENLADIVLKQLAKDKEPRDDSTINNLVANDYPYNYPQWFSRSNWLGGLLDPRRDICRECGYPEMNAFISPLVYRELYDRDSLSARVVQVMPKECWQQNPSIYEDEDSEKETEFELAWKQVHQTLRSSTKVGGSWYQDEEGSPIWEYLLRADILSGIGHYGVLLLGIDDGRPLDQPLEEFDGLDSVNPGTEGLYGPQPMRGDAMGYDAYTTKLLEEQGVPSYATPVPYNVKDTGRLPDSTEESVSSRKTGATRKLLFMKVFDESLAQITRYERDPHNARFGLPQMYLLTFNDPRNDSYGGAGLPVASAHCHWSRLIHIADNLGSNDVLGYPRMKQVFNRLWDAFKCYGAAGEGFWQQCFSILSLETNPQIGPDFNIDKRAISQQLGNLKNKLQRHIVTAGMTIKSLPPSVQDPTPFIEVFLGAICIFIGCPVRVFKGSERGELASSQDDASWNDRLRHRQLFYITPKLIVPFIDRLISVGVLPQPKPRKAANDASACGYSVVWPDLDAMTDDQKAGVAQKYMAAAQAYISAGIENILTPIDFFVEFCKLPYHVAKEIVENAQKAQLSETQQTIDTPEEIAEQQQAMQGAKYNEPMPESEDDESTGGSGAEVEGGNDEH
jgi:hypothetical protein